MECVSNETIKQLIVNQTEKHRLSMNHNDMPAGKRSCGEIRHIEDLHTDAVSSGEVFGQDSRQRFRGRSPF